MSVVNQNFQRAYSLRLMDQFHINFYMQRSSKGGQNVYIFHAGHMTKMAAMPIYGINLKNPLQNHWASCLETW